MSTASQNNSKKEQKETTKKGGISLTIMGQRRTYNSILKPQWSPNKTIGFNQDEHPYRICNETGIPEFLELQIPEIPMVVMVTSCTRSLSNPTQQDKFNSGSLLDMEAHMPSATQNNSKRKRRNNQERRNILNHNGPKANLQLNT